MSILETKRLSKSFGGLKAVKEVDLTIGQGELSSIIGPNGAGKTTLFNLISGSLVPDSGRIVFEGKDITGTSCTDVSRMGIGRAFQIANLFPRMTVYENVAVAIVSRTDQRLNFMTAMKSLVDIKTEVMEILDSLGLSDKAASLSAELSHGDQKLLDIAITLALKPGLILVDEPTSGMSPEERRTTVELLKRLWKETGTTLLFIEHDMDIVFDISQLIRVLHYGELIAEGSPDDIAKNSKVIDAYLGEETCY